MSTSASILLYLLAAASVLGGEIPSEHRPADFVRQWVRSHPFFVTGSHFNAERLDMNLYVAAHFSLFLPSAKGLLDDRYGPIPLPLWVGANQIELTEESKAFLRRVGAKPGIAGWYVRDEPHYQLFKGVGEVTAWLKQQFPDTVTFCVAFPITAKPAQMWGDDTKPDYEYHQYINDLVNTIDPDVVAYDHYPFNNRDNCHPQFFNNLMIIRNKAQSLGKAYAAAIQSFDIGFVRMPSESDLRMQVYSYLTTGYDALGYFTYSHHADGAIMDPDGKPTWLYHVVKKVNREICHLGNALRPLTSTDVRFIPGRRDNVSPIGLMNWAPGAGDDMHIRKLAIALSDPDKLTGDENGLIGFFRDDQGRTCFMLTNLNHRGGASAAETAQSFSIEFDSSVSELLMLDRQTGQESSVALTDHILTVTLPGGTGNLYKYGPDAFPACRPTTAVPADPAKQASARRESGTRNSTATAPPRISRQPTSLTAGRGEVAAFHAIAVDDGRMAYRWFKDGVPLMNGEDVSGADERTLQIGNLDTFNAGVYHCVIRNQAGRVQSSPATLTFKRASAN